MELRRGARTKIVHAAGCRRGRDVQIWGYAVHIPDETALTAHTQAFPLVHVCPYCLPGVCRCRSCAAG